MSDIELDDRQQRAVKWIVGGLSGPEAFRKAGFSDSYARKSSTVLKQPVYAAALEAERAMLREQVPYDAPAAVREIDRQIKGALAAKSPNFMAAAKLLDLKCRIYGLIKERIEIATVDLSAALSRAESRVVNGTPSPREPCTELCSTADPAVPGAAYRGPGIPGDPFAERGHGRGE
jgi:hypothetical protein